MHPVFAIDVLRLLFQVTNIKEKVRSSKIPPGDVLTDDNCGQTEFLMWLNSLNCWPLVFVETDTDEMLLQSSKEEKERGG